MIKAADISPCGKYRYELRRIWDLNKPLACLVGLNPSTADAKEDDPTIRRCIDFVTGWGYGGFIMVNLFAWRAIDPKELMLQEHRVGAFNNKYILDAVSRAKLVVFCWGNWGGIFGRDEEVIRMVPDAQCFGLTKDGHPKHPLYLHHTTQLQTFKR